MANHASLPIRSPRRAAQGRMRSLAIESMMSEGKSQQAYRRPLFWVDCGGMILLIAVACGYAPYCKRLFDDFGVCHCHRWTDILLPVPPVVWALLLSTALSVFVGAQVASDDSPRKARLRRILLVAEIVILAAFLWAVFAPLTHMHMKTT